MTPHHSEDFLSRWPNLRISHEVNMVHRSIRSHWDTQAESTRKEPSFDAATNDAQHRRQSNEGLRVEHLEAVRANVAAKRQYDEIATRSILVTPPPEHNHDTADFLGQHFGLLRLQRRHAALFGLKDELEAIKLSSGLAAVNIRCNASETFAETLPGPNELKAPADSITPHVQALELAVVQAHHEARKEKILLNRAKSLTLPTSNPTTESRVYALSAVRKELTAWVEQSLDKCQEENRALEPNGETKVDNDIDWGAKIDGQYERYLEARRRLLAVIADLRSPLSEKESNPMNGGEQFVEQTSSPPGTPEVTDIVAAIENRLLPSMQQQSVSHAHFTFADEHLQKDINTTINMLDRLSDESQILLAFPILAHSGRFEHAASAFGKKREGAEGGPKDEISNRLEQWLFAAEAADVTSTETIRKHLQQGNEAVDAVSRSLAELQFLKETLP